VLGTGQAVISASGNSWLGIGDQFSVQVAGLPDRDFPTAYPTRRYLSAAGSIPLGIDGWKLDIYGTYGVTDPRVELPVINRGLFNQEWISLSYEAVKLRDRELTFAARFEGTDQRVDLLAFNPPVPLFLSERCFGTLWA